MTSGWSQMTATGADIRDGNTVIGEVCWRLVPEKTMNGHRQLVLDPLECVQSEQVVVKQL